MKQPACKSKNGYQKAMAIYELRKQKIIAKYGKDCHKRPKEINERLTRMRMKIKNYGSAVLRIQKAEDKMHLYNRHIRSFFGYDLHKCGKWLNEADKRYLLARSIFSKAMLESGIISRRIAEFLALEDYKAPTRFRMGLLTAIKYDQEQFKTYKNFQYYVDKREGDTQQHKARIIERAMQKAYAS